MLNELTNGCFRWQKGRRSAAVYQSRFTSTRRRLNAALAGTRIGLDLRWSSQLRVSVSLTGFSNISLPKSDCSSPSASSRTVITWPGQRLPSHPPLWSDQTWTRTQRAEHSHLNFLGRPIGAQCPPGRFRSLLAIEKVALAEMPEETSMARTDTRSQRSRLSLCLWRRALETSDERLARPG